MGILTSIRRPVGGAALAFALGCAAPACAQTGGQAAAQVLDRLSLVNTRDLSFGSMIAGPAAGTVTVEPVASARSTTGGVTPFGGTVSAASFTAVAGSKASVAIVRAPTVAITLTRQGGIETMLVTNFTLDGDKPPNRKKNEIFTFTVGGTLQVAANQAEGTYVGTFDVTVDFH